MDHLSCVGVLSFIFIPTRRYFSSIFSPPEIFKKEKKSIHPSFSIIYLYSTHLFEIFIASLWKYFHLSSTQIHIQIINSNKIPKYPHLVEFLRRYNFSKKDNLYRSLVHSDLIHELGQPVFGFEIKIDGWTTIKWIVNVLAVGRGTHRHDSVSENEA